MLADQPVSLPASQPASQYASWSASLPASQPASQYASWSASLPASQPASQYASWSASLPASQPASQYASWSASQHASWSARDVPVIGELQSHLDESVRAEATVFDELLAKVLEWVNCDLQILHQPGSTAVHKVYISTLNYYVCLYCLGEGGGKRGWGGCCVLYWYGCLW